MTMDTGSERRLTAALEELYLGRTPVYRDEVLAAAVRVRQRPSWTFPGRWLPMADTVAYPALMARQPWRAIALTLLILALLAAGILLVGSRPTRLPPPFGPARNGLIAYSSGGDIFAVDPASGSAKAVVDGPDTDLRPLFSRDGTRLLFLRADKSDPTRFSLMVSDADGQHAVAVPDVPALSASDPIEFAADGRSVILATADGRIRRYSLDGSRPPASLGQGRLVEGETRPPDGGQLLFENDATPEVDLWIMNADGSNARVLLAGDRLQGGQHDLAQVRWSPTGTQFAFTCATSGDVGSSHICVADAAGKRIRTVGDTGADWFETDLVWSPDGRQLAFNRWRCVTPSTCQVQPIGVTSPDGGAVRGVGPVPASEGALFDFSPDGESLLSLPAGFADPAAGARPQHPILIDVATGGARQVSWTVASNVSWQRLAP